jgi:hypothetical protein
MLSIERLKQQLGQEDLATVESLQATERLVKTTLSQEIWELIRCIREHPEITGPNPVSGKDGADLAKVVFFAHLLGHATEIVKVQQAASVVGEQIASTIADALDLGAVTGIPDFREHEAHHA